MEFKALDSVLRTTNEKDEKVSISMKCTDMDKLVPENLGVTSAIVENVMFCHQEESNWPMQEAAVLKKKFDDVFESTRYTKALEAFTKAKKVFMATSKDLKAQLMELGAHLMAANQSKDELQACSTNLDACKGRLEALRGKIEGNNEKLQQCEQRLVALQSSARDLLQLRSQVSDLQRRARDQSNQLGDEHIVPLQTQSDEDIMRSIADFERLFGGKQQQVEEMHRDVAGLTQQIEGLRRDTDKLNEKKGQHALLKDQLVRLKDQQIEAAQSAHRKHLPNTPPPVNGQKWNLQASQQFLTRLNDEVVRSEEEAQESVARLQQMVAAKEQEHTAARMKIEKLQVELSLKTEEQNKLRDDQDDKRLELQRLAHSKGLMQETKAQFEEAQRIFNDFSDSYPARSADLKRQIKDIVDRIRLLQEQISNNSIHLQEMSLHRTELAAMDAAVNQVNIEQSQITADIADTFRSHRQILDGVCEEPSNLETLSRTVTQLNEVESEYSRIHIQKSDEMTALRSQAAAAGAVLAQSQNRSQILTAKLAEMNGRERKEFLEYYDQMIKLRSSAALKDSFDPLPPSPPPSLPLSELLKHCEETDLEAKELVLLERFGKKFLKRFAKMRRQKGGNCPCCEQPIDTPERNALYEANVQSLILKGTGTNDQQPSLELLELTSQQTGALLVAVNTLCSASSGKEGLVRELSELDGQIRSCQDSQEVLLRRIRMEESQLDDCRSRADGMSKVVRALSACQSKWQALTKRLAELMDRRRRRDAQSLFGSSGMGSNNSSLGSSIGPSRSIDELEQDIRHMSEEKDDLQQKKDRLQQDEASLNKRFYDLKALLQERELAVKGVEGANSRHRELETALVGLASLTSQVSNRLDALRRERDGCERELGELGLAFGRVRTECSQREKAIQAKLAGMRADRDELTKLLESYREVEAKNNEFLSQKIEESLAGAYSQIEAKGQQIQNVHTQINAVNAQLASQQLTRRNMALNLELRQTERELKGRMQDLQKIEAQANNDANKMRQVEAEMASLQKEAGQIGTERDTLRGKMTIYEEQRVELNRKLSSSTYKDIEDRHRKKNIEFETTNLAVSDLDNYHNALDKAVQSFHTLKIREINKIIGELWQLIYKGGDIDRIEIEAGADEANAGAKLSTRSYNYRVVMRKGDAPLDMRGRCSAGQKVLASVVIRLALAETFCLNCGILTLDEPTTNLDEANKAGLAHALARIILGRQAQQNFQLICITHDEEFVKMMNEELSSSADFNLPEYYFRVVRQEQGNSGKYFSQIERVKWDDM